MVSFRIQFIFELYLKISNEFLKKMISFRFFICEEK